jgi:serine protease AprX
MKKCVLVPWLLLSLTGFGFGSSSKISPDLQGVDPNSTVRVIVQYGQSPTTQSGQGPGGGVQGGGTLLGGLLNLAGGLLKGVVNTIFSVINAVVYTGPASDLQTLANNPNVVYISPDRVVAGELDYSAAAVNAGAASRLNLTGQGIGVAIIDSGIASSADLSYLGLLSRIVYTQDFTGGNGGDQYGHGTHVAGIVGANGTGSKCSNCTRSFVGLAPNASLINLRVLDANGAGTDSLVIQAIERAIALKQRYNIRVINLSLGRPMYETSALDPLCQAVEAAWKAGIVVVVAAGNEGRDNSVGTNGYGTIESPGSDPYVITVGAMKAMGTYPRADDLIASYSSKGPTAIDHIVKPDIVAPGNHVVSLLAPGSTLASDAQNSVPVSYYESTTSTAPSARFLMLNGTSMATPVVSGAIADMLQGQPSLTPDQVKGRLMKTAYKTFPVSSTAADPVTGQSFISEYDIMTIGAGYLDVAAALANRDVATGTAISPAAQYDSGAGNALLVFDPSSTWNDTDVYAGIAHGGTKGVWGTQEVWGTSVVNANNTLCGTNQEAWFTNSASGFGVIWGTRGLWATRGMWATSTTEADRGMWATTSSTSDSDTDFSVNK